MVAYQSSLDSALLNSVKSFVCVISYVCLLIPKYLPCLAAEEMLTVLAFWVGCYIHSLELLMSDQDLIVRVDCLGS